jgi:flagellar motility protein MotE (MotC chaperone)
MAAKSKKKSKKPNNDEEFYEDDEIEEESKSTKKSKKPKKETKEAKEKKEPKEKKSKKENKALENVGEPKKGKKLKRIILFLFLASIIAIFGFNVFGIRDRIVFGMLGNIPIVQNFIPEQNLVPDQIASLSNDELIAQVNLLQVQVNSLEAELAMAENLAEMNDTELIRLREIEAGQLEFRENQERFDEMIALGDPNAFMAFYESINPESASGLYQVAALTVQEEEEIRRYVSKFRSMDESSAADILQVLMTTDMDLVVLILQNIGSAQSGAILSEMPPEDAAIITRMLAPNQ